MRKLSGSWGVRDRGENPLVPAVTRRRRAPLIATLSLVLIVGVMATGTCAASDNILIRNATLMDLTGEADDRTVSLLVRNNLLELVTEDEVPADQFDRAFDAAGGFVIGNLDIGAAPNFMIISRDPRVQFEVLLDTRVWTVFAMQEGVVVRNRLTDAPRKTAESRSTKAGWLAYTPPPMAVPLSYQDASKWNRWDTEYVSGIFILGVMLDRMNWQSQNAGSRSLVGDVDAFDGGEIRAFRFGAIGTLNMFEKPWVYTVFAASNAYDKGFETNNLDNITFFDWRLDIPFLGNSVMSIGKQKEPISGERLQGMVYNQMQERSSAADGLLPSRNIGVVWSGSNKERASSWAFGLFNDWFDAGQDFSDSASQAVGRVTWAPLRTDEDSNLLHLGLGYRYSDAKEGFRAATEPEFNKAPKFVDITAGLDGGPLPADSLRTWNTEVSWRRGPLWLASEYIHTTADSPSLGNPELKGWWLGASWVLTGEMRPYQKKNGTFGSIPVSRSVYHNGKGAWEVSARWSTIDLNDAGLQGGEMDIASLGLTWWLTPYITASFNYRYIWHERDGIAGNASGFNTRIGVSLE